MQDLSLSPFVLGGNTFGWTSNAQESFAVLDAFVDGGGVAIDTADVYTEFLPGNPGGDSERTIGEWLASRKNRDKVQIATKAGLYTRRKCLSAAKIRVSGPSRTTHPPRSPGASLGTLTRAEEARLRRGRRHGRPLSPPRAG